MWKILYILFCIKKKWISISGLIHFSEIIMIIIIIVMTKLCVQNLCSSNIGGPVFGRWVESFGICRLLAFHRVKIPRTRKSRAMMEK